jgi:hypothetical protein
MTASETARTLPPDPSVDGWWWVMRRKQISLWAWHSDAICMPGMWGTGTRAMAPEEARAAGWRCYAPAVPPGDAT